MILKSITEKEGATVLVFEGNDAGKTIERLVAEVICDLGRNHQGVPNYAIHFASRKHPLSCSQRLRELHTKFWKYQVNIMQRNAILGDAPMHLAEAYHFVKKENKYYFSPEFISWLNRTYLESEKVAM